MRNRMAKKKYQTEEEDNILKKLIEKGVSEINREKLAELMRREPIEF